MDKNSFLIYLDYQEQFDLLSDEEAGILIKAIIKYEKTQEVPRLNGMVKMAFSFIKTQLDRDREKYQEKCEKNKENARKRWNAKNANVCDGKIRNANNADNDNDNEDDNDNENDIKKKNKKRKKFIKPTVEEIKNYCIQRKNNIDTQYFYDYYERNGWKVGKNPMVDWQATIRTWERNNKKSSSAEEEFLNG